MGLIYKVDITDENGIAYYYVGQTIKTLEERKKGHYSNKFGNMLVDDILAVNRGRDIWTTIEDNIPKYMLDERERYWIQKYKTNGCGICLNQTPGGQDWKTRPKNEVVCPEYGLSVLNKYMAAKIFDDTRISTMVIKGPLPKHIGPKKVGFKVRRPM